MFKKFTCKRRIQASCKILITVIIKSAFPHYEIFMFVLKSVEHVSLYFNNASWAMFAVDAIIFA